MGSFGLYPRTKMVLLPTTSLEDGGVSAVTRHNSKLLKKEGLFPTTGILW